MRRGVSGLYIYPGGSTRWLAGGVTGLRNRDARKKAKTKQGRRGDKETSGSEWKRKDGE